MQKRSLGKNAIGQPINAHTCTIIFMHKTKLIGTYLIL